MIRLLPSWHANLAKSQVKAPKLYLRDSGILHYLLQIESLESLRGHPSLGASWEGFALEQVLSLTHRDSNGSYFWGTHGGAELDLLMWRDGRPIGFEFKYSQVPQITKSMKMALQDLELERLYIVSPGEVCQKLHKRIEVTSLLHLAKLF